MTKNEELRRELWIKVATAVAAAVGCTDKFAPAAWANRSLEEYDAQFKDPDKTFNPF